MPKLYEFIVSWLKFSPLPLGHPGRLDVALSTRFTIPRNSPLWFFWPFTAVMHWLFWCIDHLSNRRYLECVPLSVDCWQALELGIITNFGFCPCSWWVIKVYNALLDLPLELDSVFEKFVPMKASLAIVLVLWVVYLLFACCLPEKLRALLKFLVQANEGLLHLWDTPLSCLAVQICIYYPFPSDFMLRKGNCSHWSLG